jgi:adenine-specific DNA-methyltransferase
MPQLQFKGKQFVQNYHFTVPYRVLKTVPSKSFPKGRASLDDNLIIHGDNLAALKALLPKYAGQIKCIYIDPPYNTGNEHWVYSDNVSSPMMKEWLGKEVGRDDLTRHDKWLCMMMPRLKLLRELLRDDGVIFVSIDDNEVHHLKMLMDEIFGEENYLNTFCWINNLKGRQISGVGAAKTYEYIITFAKDIQLVGLFEAPIATFKALMPSSYKGFNHEVESDEKGSFVVKNELYNTNSAFNEETRPNLVFNIHYNFKTGEIKFSDVSENKQYKGFVKISPKENNDGKHKFHAWRWSREKILSNLSDLKFIKTKNGVKIYTKVREHTHTNLKDVITDITTTIGSADMQELFGKKKIFEYPKPVDLIKILIGQFGDDAIVLDSFAGTGTTGQAVLELNKEDGGNRKFILVEMEDYADRITAERIRRVIKGVPTAKDENLKNGLGGSFTFVELGEAIDNEGILSGKRLPSFVDMARYVFYTATGKNINEKKIKELTGFIGETEEYEVYLFYKPNLEWLKTTALDLEKAKKISGKKRGKKKLVFAPAKYLDEEALKELNIEFAQLPFGIYRR